MIGCATYVATTNWSEEIPFEQGKVVLFFWQEKPSLNVITRSYGSLSVKLASSDKIIDFNLLNSDVICRFLKDGAVVREQKIFPEPYHIDKNNRIIGVISTYDKYTTPEKSKEYSLNWDEFREAVKNSDKIEFSIILKFEANGQLYSIRKTGELKKDVKRKLYWGIYD